MPSDKVGTTLYIKKICTTQKKCLRNIPFIRLMEFKLFTKKLVLQTIHLDLLSSIYCKVLYIWIVIYVLLFFNNTYFTIFAHRMVYGDNLIQIYIKHIWTKCKTSSWVKKKQHNIFCKISKLLWNVVFLIYQKRTTNYELKRIWTTLIIKLLSSKISSRHFTYNCMRFSLGYYNCNTIIRFSKFSLNRY